MLSRRADLPASFGPWKRILPRCGKCRSISRRSLKCSTVRCLSIIIVTAFLPRPWPPGDLLWLCAKLFSPVHRVRQRSFHLSGPSVPHEGRNARPSPPIWLSVQVDFQPAIVDSEGKTMFFTIASYLVQIQLMVLPSCQLAFEAQLYHRLFAAQRL